MATAIGNEEYMQQGDSSAKIKLGIVGCAHCHTPWIVGVLNARTDAYVKAVYDHDTLRAENSAKVLGCAVVKSAQAIWEDPEITAVFVCSETDRHLQDILAAAKAKKHVFVEKPLGIGADDAYRAANALEDAQVLFSTGYRTRSEGIFIFLRDQIRKGHFGKITRLRYINCHNGALKGGFGPEHRWMTDPKQAGGGAFLDLGTHALDSILWLMNEEAVSATAVVGKTGISQGKWDCDEYGEGLVKFANGVIGSIAAGWVDVDQPVRCVISGTEGHAHVTNGMLYFKSSHVPGADGKTPWTELPLDRAVAFDLFVDAVAGKSEADFITVREAARVCAVQEALAQGAKENRWVKPQWL